MFSVQSGYSWYLSASLCVFCMVRASLQMTTGQALLSSLTEFKQGLWLPAAPSTPGAIIASGKSCGGDLTIWHQAGGKELPSGDKLPQGKSPQDDGVPLDSSRWPPLEIQSRARFELWVFLPVCLFLGNQLKFDWMKIYMLLRHCGVVLCLRSHLSFSTILEYSQQDFCLT